MQTKTATSSPPSNSLAAWQARALHTITCPSGQRVRIRIVGLGAILEQGDLPDDLIDIVLLELSSEQGAAGVIAKDIAADGIDGEQRSRALKRLSDYGRLMRHLAVTAIEQVEVAPDEWEPVKLTLDSDLDGLPEDDLAMVAEIMQRVRAVDAKGVTIGVEPLNRWGIFREEHGCAASGCEACEKVIGRLSTSHVGAV